MHVKELKFLLGDKESIDKLTKYATEELGATTCDELIRTIKDLQEFRARVYMEDRQLAVKIMQEIK